MCFPAAEASEHIVLSQQKSGGLSSQPKWTTKSSKMMFSTMINDLYKHMFLFHRMQKTWHKLTGFLCGDFLSFTFYCCFGTVRKRSFFYRVKLSFLGKIFLKDLFYHAVWKTHKKTVDKSCLCRGKPTTSFPHMHHCVLIQSTQKWRSIHRWVGWRSVCASEWERSDKGDLIFFWMVKKYENQWVSPTLRLKAAITSFN